MAEVSTSAQTRLQTLLEKNREAKLTHMEMEELDVYEQLEHSNDFTQSKSIFCH